MQSQTMESYLQLKWCNQICKIFSHKLWNYIYAVTNDVIKCAIKYAITNYIIKKEINNNFVFPNMPCATHARGYVLVLFPWDKKLGKSKKIVKDSFCLKPYLIFIYKYLETFDFDFGVLRILLPQYSFVSSKPNPYIWYFKNTKELPWDFKTKN